MRWMSPCSLSRWCTSRSRSRKASCRSLLKKSSQRESSQYKSLRWRNLHCCRCCLLSVQAVAKYVKAICKFGIYCVWQIQTVQICILAPQKNTFTLRAFSIWRILFLPRDSILYERKNTIDSARWVRGNTVSELTAVTDRRLRNVVSTFLQIYVQLLWGAALLK